jgi:ubiquinone/menaquinone biosynthesis C-methylase UbiE
MTGLKHSLFDFDKLAYGYDEWYDTPRGCFYDHIQKCDVLKLLPKSSNSELLLDIGCGTGHWSRFFRDLGYLVVGMDVSKSMIGVAQGKPGSQVVYMLGDACFLPFKTGMFDVVVAMATLEFVSDPSSALKEMFRCVRDGGSVIIGTLNRMAQVNRKRLSRKKQPYASGHLFTPSELKALLEPFGSVRMRASSLDGQTIKKQRKRGIYTNSSPGRPSLKGAFIVAEVKRIC